MNKLKRLLIVPLALLLACTAALGIITLDTHLRDYGSTPLRMEANAIIVFDGYKTAQISSVDVCSPSMLKLRPGWIAYQIWNWDKTWFSTKAFRMVANRAMEVTVQTGKPESK